MSADSVQDSALMGWQLDVSEKLGTLVAAVPAMREQLTGELRGVKDQVTRQNGNVARLQADQIELNRRVGSVESKLVADEAAENAVNENNSKWAKVGEKVLLIVGAIIVYHVGGHGPDIIKGLVGIFTK